MALAVVQSASTAATSPTGAGAQPHSNWGVAPTNGNLLLAFGFNRNNHNPTGANSWIVLSAVATANWYLVLYYKYASSTPTSENVDSGTNYQEWGLQFWEISGVTGDINRDFMTVHFAGQNGSNTTFANGTVTSTPGTQLVLSMDAGQLSANTSTISWSGATGWSFDSTLVSSTTNAIANYSWASGGHQAVGANTSYSSTITSSGTAPAWTGGYVELGSRTYNSASKFLGYAALSPPQNAASASKLLGYAALSPPQNAASVSKLLGYAVLGPANLLGQAWL